MKYLKPEIEFTYYKLGDVIMVSGGDVWTGDDFPEWEQEQQNIL